MDINIVKQINDILNDINIINFVNIDFINYIRNVIRNYFPILNNID